MKNKVELFFEAASSDGAKWDDGIWLEFPVYAIGSVLSKYESLLKEDTPDGWWSCEHCLGVNIDACSWCSECGKERRLP